MASASFRESMNSLGWSRRDADIPVNTSQQSGLLSSIKSLNPFGDRGYVRLPTTEGAGAPLPAPTRREEEEGWFVCELIKSLPFSEHACTRASIPALPWQSSRQSLHFRFCPLRRAADAGHVPFLHMSQSSAHEHLSITLGLSLRRAFPATMGRTFYPIFSVRGWLMACCFAK